MHCPQCATPNPEDGHFCTHCGHSLTEPTPDEVTRENFRAILGPKNQEYYLQRFEEYEANGKTTIGWHWPAFFITFYWLLYRKMWLAALLYFILPYVCTSVLGLITSLLGESRGLMMLGCYLAYTLAILLLPPYSPTPSTTAIARARSAKQKHCIANDNASWAISVPRAAPAASYCLWC